MVHDPLGDHERNAPVLGVILVGGASRRYGQDKAMAHLDGIPMVQRVATRVGPQVSMLVASGAGRPGLDLAVIPDAEPHGGPFQALLSTLIWAGERDFELVATFSCDTPFLPPNLVMRLRRVLNHDRDCAVALHNGAAHPTCALWKTSALHKVRNCFDLGTRSLHGALAALNTCSAEFSDMAEGPAGDPFFNINSPSEMADAEGWLSGMSSMDRVKGLCSKVSA